MSPTQRTLAKLREDGYVCAIVEKWNPYARIRQDLFGFIDVVAIRSTDAGVLGIQTTSGSNISARISKIQASPYYQIWKSSGNRIEVWGWSKKGKKGERKTWQVRIVVL